MVSCSFMRRTRPNLRLYWLNAEWFWISSEGLEVSFSYEMLRCDRVKRPQRFVNTCRISRQPEKTEPTLGGQTSRAVFLETFSHFSKISRLNMWRGGGCLRTLDNLPGWSYGAVNSAIFEYYTKVARNPRSLLEPWRMSANDYQVHIFFPHIINIYIYMYITYYIIYR